MHIIFATPEIAPFSQTSPLAEFSASLASSTRSYRPGLVPELYADREEDPATLTTPVGSVAIITPLYSTMDPEELHLARRLTQLVVPWKGRSKKTVTVYEGATPERVPVFFLSHDLFGDAPLTGPEHSEDIENATRYAFFSRAVLEFCRTFSRSVDIIHGLGWTTALIPLYLCTAYEKDDKLIDVLTVLHLRDLSAQGRVPSTTLRNIGLPKRLIDPEEISDADGQCNFTRGGILFADHIVTSSPTFARQSQSKSHGKGLHIALAERRGELVGVQEGLDHSRWDPASDSFLPVKYDAEHLNGKRRNKAELQHIFGLPVRPLKLLVGLVGPFSEAGGANLTADAIEDLLNDDLPLQFVVMGDGEHGSKKHLVELAERHPRSVSLHFEHDDALMHRLLAGVDIIIDPRPENPHGLLALMGLRYGTIPIAFRTGGNIDNVIDADDAKTPFPTTKGVGFLFAEWTADDLAATLDGAIETYANKKEWRPMVDHSMQVNLSLTTMAHHVIHLYDKLLSV